MRIAPPAAYVADTGTVKGRGVFAARAFAAGELVEMCPVLLFELPAAVAPLSLKHVVFNWRYLTGAPELHALALGYGSLYNHDNPANMRYEGVAAIPAMRFIAVRRIEPDEEFTINYNAHGGDAAWSDDAWFERMNIKPLIG
jgi:hypothetical protein